MTSPGSRNESRHGSGEPDAGPTRNRGSAEHDSAASTREVDSGPDTLEDDTASGHDVATAADVNESATREGESAAATEATRAATTEGAPPAQSSASAVVPAPSGRKRWLMDYLKSELPDPEALAISARSIVLAAMIGFALVAWAQFSFASDWVSMFVKTNKLEMSRRMVLLYSLLGGAGVAAAACAFALNWADTRGRDLRQIERWLWLASPLILLPVVPLLFRYKAWKNRHEELLPCVLLTGLAIEVLIARALQVGPEKGLAKLREPFQAIPRILRQHGPTLAVAAGVLFYCVFFSYYTVLNHYQLGTGNYDLSINNNLIYNGLNGVFNQSAIVFPEEPSKYLANHLKIGVYTLLPIYALYPKAEMLLILQSVLMGLGALPLYGFARRRVSDLTAAIIALCYLAYYPLHGANFYEVKLVPMASFFVLATVWAADRKYWVLMALAFIQALLFREDMPIGLAAIAAVLLLSGHRPIAGASMLLVAICWFVFIRFHVMDEAGKWWFPKMYKDLWSPGEQGFKSVIKTLLTNPYFALQHIIVEKKIIYLMHLLVPVMFLPARRWYLWAAFVPGAILTLLVTDYDPVITYSFQYVMHWAPYLFLAVPLALVAIKRRGQHGPARAKAAFVSFAFASLVLSYNFGAFARRPIKGGYHTIGFHFSKSEQRRYNDLRELIKLVPDEASVAATEKVGPHLSSRRHFYSLRKGTWDAQYLVARDRELNLQKTRPTLYDALDSGKYGVLKRQGEFAVMKKGHSTAENRNLIVDWKLRRDSDDDESDSKSKSEE